VFGERGFDRFPDYAAASTESVLLLGIVLATVFFLVSLSLAYLVSGRSPVSGSVVEQQLRSQQPPAEAAPAVPEAATPAVPAPEAGKDQPKTPAVPE